MTDHPNAARLRRGHEAFNSGDVTALREMFAEDVVWHVAGNNRMSGEHRGKEAVFAAFAKTVGVPPLGFKIELHDVLANDDHAVTLARYTASRQGKQLDMRDITVYHIRNGKVTEFWSITEDQRATDEFWS